MPLTKGKFNLTVSHETRTGFGIARRPDPAQGVRAAAFGPAVGRRDREGAAGEPPGGLAASRRVEGGGPRDRPTGRDAAGLHHRSPPAPRPGRPVPPILGPG